MIITINGTPGSGKSTLAKYLARNLNMKHYSMGDFMRKIAVEKGMKINELSKIGEKKDWVDKKIDKYQIELARKEDNFVIDGRLSWHFIPRSIKLFVKADPKMTAERIFKAKRGSEKPYKNIKEALKSAKERVKSEIKRYWKYYKLKNVYDIKNYDIIIDTSYLTIPEMEKAAFNAVKAYKKM
jgi:cytidylate kinase